MKKNQVLFITCTFSITILTIQTFILRLLLQKEIKEEKVDPAYSSISKVISHSVKHNVPLFLIDPKILYRAHVSSDEEDHIDCHFICLGQKVLHLGTIGPLTTQFQKNSFTEALEAESFKVMQFVGFEPILQQHGLNSPIPLHFIISDNHIAIHVAFFYERPGKFWWTGGYNLKQEELHSLYEMDFKKEDLLLLLQSAAFDKMEIHSASIDKIRIFVPLQHHMFLNFPNDSKFIECNYSQAKVFFEKFGRDESDEAEIFRTKAWKLLAKAKSLLDHLKIPFWLSSGTLLGYYRECGFISYSKDVDIGIWIKDFRPEIISLFSTNDMPLIHSFGKRSHMCGMEARKQGLGKSSNICFQNLNFVGLSF
ncbi:ribitol-5-phosphate transferase FKTN isoform X2 [Parasteatoda tepidariorum]|uniref:ribitol-5-phosphate transferase FKTN isoform X2 n=1 Tax=Parasteatoda tepidariorum TaxID=114398 RepID=UPI0039BD02BE